MPRTGPNFVSTSKRRSIEDSSFEGTVRVVFGKPDLSETFKLKTIVRIDIRKERFVFNIYDEVS